VVARNRYKPFRKLSLPVFTGERQGGFFKWLFLLSAPYSKTMRYVGGGLLKNPVTRANQSREGGRRIEPGGREKSYKSVLLVTAWLHTTDTNVKVSDLLFQYGKSLLCSNIHHQRGCSRGLKLWITLKVNYESIANKE
jgi:hypothetical protein